MNATQTRTIVIRYERVGDGLAFTARFIDCSLPEPVGEMERSVGTTPWQAVENLYIGTAALESFDLDA